MSHHPVRDTNKESMPAAGALQILSDSPNHNNSTREATVLCRGVLIAYGKHVRKTVSFGISWTQGKNYSMWEAVK